MKAFLPRGRKHRHLINYDVRVDSFPQLVSYYKNKAPLLRRSGGSTTLWWWTYKDGKKVGFDYQIVMIMPRYASRNKQLLKKLNAYCGRLLKHEGNHAGLYQAAVNKMLRVKAKNKSSLEKKFQRITRAVDKLSNKYDTVSDSGRKEGLPISFKGRAKNFDAWLRRAGSDIKKIGI